MRNNLGVAAKNSVKEYISNGFYHIYNRGVEKRNIFLDEQDYSVFLSYLKTYLSPKDIAGLEVIYSDPNSNPAEKEKALRLLKLKNYFENIELLAYSLLPNHFHFLIKQVEANSIDLFMNSLGARYAKYFNRRHKRVGGLFQDVYKAVLINSEEQLIHVSRYIHLNPFLWANLPVQEKNITVYPSSLPEYLNKRQTTWVKPLSFIPNYWNFISTYVDLDCIRGLTLDPELD